MIDDALKTAKEKMEKCLKALEADLSKIRTGRAHPSILEHIRVDYYGTPTALNQVANVAVEDARTLTITPWEKTMIAPIEKAIITSELGLNPATAGMIIRIPLPPLTEERRKGLAKMVRDEAEKARVAVRNARRDANTALKDLQKDKQISEDDQRRGEADIQKLTDTMVSKVDALCAAKEKDLMQV